MHPDEPREEVQTRCNDRRRFGAFLVGRAVGIEPGDDEIVGGGKSEVADRSEKLRK